MQKPVNINGMLYLMGICRQPCLIDDFLQIILQVFVIYRSLHILQQIYKSICVKAIVGNYLCSIFGIKFILCEIFLFHNLFLFRSHRF